MGYSLGGNLTLKLAGEYGSAAPPQLRAACAVSPTIDLARCVAALARPENRLYQWNFVRNLKRRMRRKARRFPGHYTLNGIGRVRSVRDFDEMFTAPYNRFLGADDYYHRASALRVIHRVRVPTLIISAEDDPFVPPEQFADAALVANPHVHRLITRHGGHCGFVSAEAAGDDGYWAERRAVAFGLEHIAERAGPVATTPER